MPKPSSPLERCNAVLRAFDTPFRLRQHRRSQWAPFASGFALLCVSYPTSDCTITTGVEDDL